MALSGQAESLAIVTIFLLCLSQIIVSLRCWVRISIKAFGLDDWLIAIGQAIYFGVGIPLIIGAHNGIGIRDIHLTQNQMMTARKCLFFSQIFYTVDTTFVKSAICVALIRFSYHEPAVYYPAFIVIAISFIAGATTFTSGFIQCKPIEANWNPAAGKCLSPLIIVDLGYFTSAAAMLTDLSCAILPIMLLWNANMNWKIKSTTICLLSFGCVASTATIIRIKALANYKQTTDYLYGISPVALWSMIELGLGISAGSAATLRHLPRLISGGSLRSSSRSKNYVRHRPNAIDIFAIDTDNDVSLQVMVKGGKAPSVGGAESQKATIGEAAISIRSDANVVEEFAGRDIV